MASDYVVEFKLPTDKHLFIRHGVNVFQVRNRQAAIDKARLFLPSDAHILCAYLGVVMLYGSKWSTWDSTLGAECSPSDD